MYGYGHSAGGDSIYNQYLQHHTQMTQWFEQLQQTINPTRAAYGCNSTHARPSCRGHTMQHYGALQPCCNARGRPTFRGPRHCCSAQARPACVTQPCCPSFPMPHVRPGPLNIPQYIAPSRGRMAHVPAGRHSGRVLRPHGYPVSAPAHRQAQVAQTYVEKQEEESEESSTEEEDNSSSDDEIVCDVDAFIALRAARRDDSDKASVDSFELVDSVEDEKFKFEYVEMDEFGITQKRYGKRREVNTMEDENLKKEQRQYLYGERADAMSGLETLMAINFSHITDMNQPILWPVLPLNL